MSVKMKCDGMVAESLAYIISNGLVFQVLASLWIGRIQHGVQQVFLLNRIAFAVLNN